MDTNHEMIPSKDKLDNAVQVIKDAILLIHNLRSLSPFITVFPSPLPLLSCQQRIEYRTFAVPLLSPY